MSLDEVIVLGGYGRVGSLCVRELLETTRARIVIAGPSVQRAAAAALGHGARASAAYADASDQRTLRECLPGAAAVIACSVEAPSAAIQQALEARVPLISITPVEWTPGHCTELAERAWKAQVPVILHAGVSPGLAGVVAELLVRRFERLHELRILCTGRPRPSGGAPVELGAPFGSWRGLVRSLDGVRRLHSCLIGDFQAEIGRRLVLPAQAPDLEDFRARHCVERVLYLEPDAGALGPGIDRLLGRDPITGFALIGEAFSEPRARQPAARASIRAADVAAAAAAAAVILVRGVLAGRVPAGLLTPREALNPRTLLDALGKRGVTIQTEGL